MKLKFNKKGIKQQIGKAIGRKPSNLFGNLRSTLNNPKIKSMAKGAINQLGKMNPQMGGMANAAASALGMNESPAMQPKLQEAAAPMSPMQQAAQPPASQSIGPAQQDQQMREQLIKPSAPPQPPTQASGSPQPEEQQMQSPDNSAIDSQIASLQAQLQQLQAQKK